MWEKFSGTVFTFHYSKTIIHELRILHRHFNVRIEVHNCHFLLISNWQLVLVIGNWHAVRELNEDKLLTFVLWFRWRMWLWRWWWLLWRFVIDMDNRWFWISIFCCRMRVRNCSRRNGQQILGLGLCLGLGLGLGLELLILDHRNRGCSRRWKWWKWGIHLEKWKVPFLTHQLAVECW